MVLENHEVATWTKEDAARSQKPLEVLPQIGEIQSDHSKSHDVVEIALCTPIVIAVVSKNDEAVPAIPPAKKRGFDHLAAVVYMVFHMRVLTPLLISFVNGFLTTGIYNTALVLRLNERYGLDSTAAGLVYFAVAIPQTVVSPLAVILGRFDQNALLI